MGLARVLIHRGSPSINRVRPAPKAFAFDTPTPQLSRPNYVLPQLHIKPRGVLPPCIRLSEFPCSRQRYQAWILILWKDGDAVAGSIRPTVSRNAEEAEETRSWAARKSVETQLKLH